jgi:hypothetical protein
VNRDGEPGFDAVTVLLPSNMQLPKQGQAMVPPAKGLLFPLRLVVLLLNLNGFAFAGHLKRINRSRRAGHGNGKNEQAADSVAAPPLKRSLHCRRALRCLEDYQDQLIIRSDQTRSQQP